jgi:hypothetical protein
MMLTNYEYLRIDTYQETSPYMHIRSIYLYSLWYEVRVYVMRTKHDLRVATFAHIPLPDLAAIEVLRSALCRISSMADGSQGRRAGESGPLNRIITPGDVMCDPLP